MDVRGWLVIEDDQELLKVLVKLTPEAEKLPPASRADVARSLLLARPQRVISFDLGMSDGRGIVSTSTGAELLVQSRHPLSKALVYTGYRESQDGMNAIYEAGERALWVLAKGAKNEVQGRVATATPLGWCALMLHLQGYPLPDAWGILKEEAQVFLASLAKKNPLATEAWPRSFWRQAAIHLPQPLAEAADRYREAVDHSTDVPLLAREGLLALNDLREWLVWFCASQTAVILRASAALNAAAERGLGLGDAHDWLSRQLQPLHALPPTAAGAVSWRNHLGVYTRPGPKGADAFESLGLDALEALRQKRNVNVHGLRPIRMPESDLTMLPTLMDLASYWASNPLLTQVRREGGRWRAKALCGKEPGDRELPDDLAGLGTGWQADPNRVYQLVWRFSGQGPAEHGSWASLGTPTPVLLDWWPYLRLAFNRELGRAEPMLLTGPERPGSRHWHAQTFSGALRKPELTHEEAASLTQLPR